MSPASEMSQQGFTVTASHGLGCSHIIFLSMDTFSRGWDKGVATALSEAGRMGWRSLALPALGAGEEYSHLNDKTQTVIDACPAVKQGVDGKPGEGVGALTM